METIKDIVKEINQAFRDNDMQTFVNHCAEDVVWTMIGHETVHGRQGILDFMKNMPSGSEPILTEDIIIADGNYASCTGTMEMKNPDGSPYHGAFCDVYRFEDGKAKVIDSYIIHLKQPA